MIRTLLLAALAAAPAAPKAAPPPAPPREIRLPALAGAPLLGAPTFSPDGKKLLVARYGAGETGPLALGGKLWLVGTAPGAAPPEAIAVDGPNYGGRFEAALSPDGRRIAYLAGGELWVRAAPGSDATPAEPTRLYPPKAGDAPLGEKVSHLCWSMDGTWLLVQSPLGWARVGVEKGEVAALPLKPVDLDGGSLVLGTDGIHAAFVRPTSGPGWINGARVVAINTETGQAALADFDNDYVALALLPDSQLLGEDAGGVLWVLHGHERGLYFRPPGLPEGATVSGYAVSLDGKRLAYVVTETRGGVPTRSHLYVAGAPPLPKWPKPGSD